MNCQTAVLILAALFSTSPLASAQAEYPRLAIVVANVETHLDGFDTFLAELHRAADERDPNLLESHVSEDFFWDHDFGGGFDPTAAPLDNLATALSLRDADLSPEYRGSGWRKFSLLLEEQTQVDHTERTGIVCVPGEPVFADPQLAEQTFEETGTDRWFDWGYVGESGIEVLEQPLSGAASLAILDREAVRVHQWPGGSEEESWAEVETSGGQRGFVLQKDLESWLPDRLCFERVAGGGWKIAGFLGGGD